MASFQIPSFLTEFVIWLNRTHQGNADEKLYTQGNVDTWIGKKKLDDFIEENKEFWLKKD